MFSQPSTTWVRGAIHQQDGAAVHTAKHVREFLKENGVRLLTWPAQSPDMSPIEHIWQLMKQGIEKKTFANRDELWKELKEIWASITPEQCAALVNACPRHCAVVVAAEGR